MNELRNIRRELNARLLERVEALARYLFPNGKKVGGSWRLGSLDINLRTGFWGDWDGSTESMSRNLVNLWIHAMHVDFQTAIAQITDWLGLPETGRPLKAVSAVGSAKQASGRKLVLPLLEEPTRAELQQLSSLRSISVPALEIAVRRGFLWCYTDPREKIRAWLLTDSARKSAIGRRLDGRPWAAIGDKKSKTLKGSWASWPVGILEAQSYSCIGLVEGVPDFLALIEQASAFDVVDRVAPVCVAGAQLLIPESVLPRFAGKRIRIFEHDDQAAKAAAGRWWEQLRQVADVDFYKFDGLVQTNGWPVEDLNDFCRLDPASREAYRKEVDELLDFVMEGKGRD